jgi:hypothetical protein
MKNPNRGSPRKTSLVALKVSGIASDFDGRLVSIDDGEAVSRNLSTHAHSIEEHNNVYRQFAI